MVAHTPLILCAHFAEVAIIDPRYKLFFQPESEMRRGLAGVLNLQDQIAEAARRPWSAMMEKEPLAIEMTAPRRGAAGQGGIAISHSPIPHADDPQDALVLSLMRLIQPFAPVTLRHLEDHFQLTKGTAPRKASFTRRQGAKTAAPGHLRPVAGSCRKAESPSGRCASCKVKDAAKSGRNGPRCQLMEEDGELLDSSPAKTGAKFGAACQSRWRNT